MHRKRKYQLLIRIFMLLFVARVVSLHENIGDKVTEQRSTINDDDNFHIPTNVRAVKIRTDSKRSDVKIPFNGASKNLFTIANIEQLNTVHSVVLGSAFKRKNGYNATTGETTNNVYEESEMAQKRANFANASEPEELEDNYYGSKKKPAKSCRDIFLTNRDMPSGNYWIRTADGELLLVTCGFPGHPETEKTEQDELPGEKLSVVHNPDHTTVYKRRKFDWQFQKEKLTSEDENDASKENLKTKAPETNDSVEHESLQQDISKSKDSSSSHVDSSGALGAALNNRNDMFEKDENLKGELRDGIEGSKADDFQFVKLGNKKSAKPSPAPDDRPTQPMKATTARMFADVQLHNTIIPMIKNKPTKSLQGFANNKPTKKVMPITTHDPTSMFEAMESMVGPPTKHVAPDLKDNIKLDKPTVHSTTPLKAKTTAKPSQLQTRKKLKEEEKNEEKSEKWDKEVKKEKDLQIKEKEMELKEKESKLKEKESKLKEKETELKEKESLIKEKSISKKNQEKDADSVTQVPFDEKEKNEEREAKPTKAMSNEVTTFKTTKPLDPRITGKSDTLSSGATGGNSSHSQKDILKNSQELLENSKALLENSQKILENSKEPLLNSKKLLENSKEILETTKPLQNDSQEKPAQNTENKTSQQQPLVALLPVPTTNENVAVLPQGGSILPAIPGELAAQQPANIFQPVASHLTHPAVIGAEPFHQAGAGDLGDIQDEERPPPKLKASDEIYGRRDSTSVRPKEDQGKGEPISAPMSPQDFEANAEVRSWSSHEKAMQAKHDFNKQYNGFKVIEADPSMPHMKKDEENAQTRSWAHHEFQMQSKQMQEQYDDFARAAQLNASTNEFSKTYKEFEKMRNETLANISSNNKMEKEKPAVDFPNATVVTKPQAPVAPPVASPAPEEKEPKINNFMRHKFDNETDDDYEKYVKEVDSTDQSDRLEHDPSSGLKEEKPKVNEEKTKLNDDKVKLNEEKTKPDENKAKANEEKPKAVEESPKKEEEKAKVEDDKNKQNESTIIEKVAEIGPPAPPKSDEIKNAASNASATSSNTTGPFPPLEPLSPLALTNPKMNTLVNTTLPASTHVLIQIANHTDMYSNAPLGNSSRSSLTVGKSDDGKMTEIKKADATVMITGKKRHESERPDQQKKDEAIAKAALAKNDKLASLLATTTAGQTHGKSYFMNQSLSNKLEDDVLNDYNHIKEYRKTVREGFDPLNANLVDSYFPVEKQMTRNNVKGDTQTKKVINNKTKKSDEYSLYKKLKGRLKVEEGKTGSAIYVDNRVFIYGGGKEKSDLPNKLMKEDSLTGSSKSDIEENELSLGEGSSKVIVMMKQPITRIVSVKDDDKDNDILPVKKTGIIEDVNPKNLTDEKTELKENNVKMINEEDPHAAGNEKDIIHTEIADEATAEKQSSLQLKSKPKITSIPNPYNFIVPETKKLLESDSKPDNKDNIALKSDPATLAKVKAPILAALESDKTQGPIHGIHETSINNYEAISNENAVKETINKGTAPVKANKTDVVSEKPGDTAAQVQDSDLYRKDQRPRTPTVPMKRNPTGKASGTTPIIVYFADKNKDKTPDIAHLKSIIEKQKLSPTSNILKVTSIKNAIERNNALEGKGEKDVLPKKVESEHLSTEERSSLLRSYYLKTANESDIDVPNPTPKKNDVTGGKRDKYQSPINQENLPGAADTSAKSEDVPEPFDLTNIHSPIKPISHTMQDLISQTQANMGNLPGLTNETNSNNSNSQNKDATTRETIPQHNNLRKEDVHNPINAENLPFMEKRFRIAKNYLHKARENSKYYRDRLNILHLRRTRRSAPTLPSKKAQHMNYLLSHAARRYLSHLKKVAATAPRLRQYKKHMIMPANRIHTKHDDEPGDLMLFHFKNSATSELKKKPIIGRSGVIKKAMDDTRKDFQRGAPPPAIFQTMMNAQLLQDIVDASRNSDINQMRSFHVPTGESIITMPELHILNLINRSLNTVFNIKNSQLGAGGTRYNDITRYPITKKQIIKIIQSIEKLNTQKRGDNTPMLDFTKISDMAMATFQKFLSRHNYSGSTIHEDVFPEPKYDVGRHTSTMNERSRKNISERLQVFGGSRSRTFRDYLLKSHPDIEERAALKHIVKDKDSSNDNVQKIVISRNYLFDQNATNEGETQKRELIPSRIGVLQPSNLKPMPPIGHDPDEDPFQALVGAEIGKGSNASKQFNVLYTDNDKPVDVDSSLTDNSDKTAFIVKENASIHQIDKQGDAKNSSNLLEYNDAAKVNTNNSLVSTEYNGHDKAMANSSQENHSPDMKENAKLNSSSVSEHTNEAIETKNNASTESLLKEEKDTMKINSSSVSLNSNEEKDLVKGLKTSEHTNQMNSSEFNEKENARENSSVSNLNNEKSKNVVKNNTNGSVEEVSKENLPYVYPYLILPNFNMTHLLHRDEQLKLLQPQSQGENSSTVQKLGDVDHTKANSSSSLMNQELNSTTASLLEDSSKTKQNTTTTFDTPEGANKQNESLKINAANVKENNEQAENEQHPPVGPDGKPHADSGPQEGRINHAKANAPQDNYNETAPDVGESGRHEVGSSHITGTLKSTPERESKADEKEIDTTFEAGLAEEEKNARKDASDRKKAAAAKEKEEDMKKNVNAEETKNMNNATSKEASIQVKNSSLEVNEEQKTNLNDAKASNAKEIKSNNESLSNNEVEKSSASMKDNGNSKNAAENKSESGEALFKGDTNSNTQEAIAGNNIYHQTHEIFSIRNQNDTNPANMVISSEASFGNKVNFTKVQIDIKPIAKQTSNDSGASSGVTGDSRETKEMNSIKENIEKIVKQQSTNVKYPHLKLPTKNGEYIGPQDIFDDLGGSQPTKASLKKKEDVSGPNDNDINPHMLPTKPSGTSTTARQKPRTPKIGKIEHKNLNEEEFKNIVDSTPTESAGGVRSATKPPKHPTAPLIGKQAVKEEPKKQKESPVPAPAASLSEPKGAGAESQSGLNWTVVQELLKDAHVKSPPKSPAAATQPANEDNENVPLLANTSNGKSVPLIPIPMDSPLGKLLYPALGHGDNAPPQTDLGVNNLTPNFAAAGDELDLSSILFEPTQKLAQKRNNQNVLNKLLQGTTYSEDPLEIQRSSATRKQVVLLPDKRGTINAKANYLSDLGKESAKQQHKTQQLLQDQKQQQEQQQQQTKSGITFDSIKLNTENKDKNVNMPPELTARLNIPLISNNNNNLQQGETDKTDGQIHITVQNKNGHLVLIPDQKEAYQQQMVPQSIKLDLLYKVSRMQKKDRIETNKKMKRKNVDYVYRATKDGKITGIIAPRK